VSGRTRDTRDAQLLTIMDGTNDTLMTTMTAHL